MQNCAQQTSGDCRFAEAEAGLGFEEQRRCFLAGRHIVVEQQHRGQRRGEVIDGGRSFCEALRVGQQLAQEAFCLPAAAKLFQGLAE